MRLKAFSWHCHANARPHFPFAFLFFFSYWITAFCCSMWHKRRVPLCSQVPRNPSAHSQCQHARTLTHTRLVYSLLEVCMSQEGLSHSRATSAWSRGIAGVKLAPEGKFVIIFARQNPLQSCQLLRAIQIPECPAGICARQPEQDIVVVLTLWLCCCFILKQFQRLTLKLKSKGCK